MKETDRAELIKQLRKGWKYINDVRGVPAGSCPSSFKKMYVIVFQHKQTGIIKLTRTSVAYHDWIKDINTSLRVCEYRKWGKALNKL